MSSDTQATKPLPAIVRHPGRRIKSQVIISRLRILILGMTDRLFEEYKKAFSEIPEVQVIGADELLSNPSLPEPDVDCLANMLLPDKTTNPRTIGSSVRIPPGDFPDLVIVNCQSEKYEDQINCLRGLGVEAPILAGYIDSSGMYIGEMMGGLITAPPVERNLTHSIGKFPESVSKRVMQVVWLMRVMTWLDNDEEEFKRILKLYQKNVSKDPQVCLRTMATNWSKEEMWDCKYGP